jgi:hypothetical protein
LIPHIQAQWVLITIAVLVSSEVRLGAVLQKTSGRVLGTVLGALPALAIVYIGGENTHAAHYGLLLVVAVMTYWGVSLYETSPTATLALVTASMLLADPTQTREHALIRLASIGVGAVIALLCAHLIFPIRSRWALRQSMLDTMTLQRDYTQLLADRKEPPPELAANIFSKLTLQRRLIDEARLEAAGFNRDHHLQVWTRQRVLFRYLQVAALATVHADLHPELAQLGPVARDLTRLIREGGPPPPQGEQPTAPSLPEISPEFLDFCLVAVRKTLAELVVVEPAVANPVAEVNAQAEDQPSEETDPGQGGRAAHQDEAKEDPQDGEKGCKGGVEGSSGTSGQTSELDGAPDRQHHHQGQGDDQLGVLVEDAQSHRQNDG